MEHSNALNDQKEIQLEMMSHHYNNLLEMEKDVEGKMKVGTETVLEQLNAFFMKSFEKQKNGVKGEVFYIVISFLRSYILLNEYKVRVDLYDGAYYLDMNECSTEIDVTFILDYMDRDIAFLTKKYINEQGELSTYYVEQMKKQIMPIYIELLEKFFLSIVSEIVQLDGYELLIKGQELKIFYGEYLDRSMQIF